MKEDLTEAEKACLDYYRECISKSLMFPKGAYSQIYQAGRTLYKKLNEKWKPSGVFHLSTEGTAWRESSHSRKQKLINSGNIYKTREEAEADAKNLKNLRLINARIRELNAETGWVAGWEDDKQWKGMPMYNYIQKAWTCEMYYYSRVAGAEYSSKKNNREGC